jgi:hypothetical protein
MALRECVALVADISEDAVAGVTVAAGVLLILLYCYRFRSYDHHQEENILLARITQLTTDPLFYNIANIIVIVSYN